LKSGVDPDALADAFLKAPLFQTDYDKGFGTLFTAECDPLTRSLTLRWPDQVWRQTLEAFAEGRRVIRYGRASGSAQAVLDPIDAIETVIPYLAPAASHAVGRWVDRSRRGCPDWAALGRSFGSFVM
jgi:hypothetical protein